MVTSSMWVVGWWVVVASLVWVGAVIEWLHCRCGRCGGGSGGGLSTLLVVVAVIDAGGGVVVMSTEVVGWLRRCHGYGQHMVMVVVVNNVDILWFNVLI